MQFGYAEPQRDRVTQPQSTPSEASVVSSDASSLVAEIVGDRKRVLDLGCGFGGAARLFAQRECDVVGIDRDPLALEEARQYCAHAYLADIDLTSPAELCGDARFDAVVLSDVLGYLREPLRLLDECRDLLREGGSLIVAVENVAHGSTRLALLDGSFEYPDGGLLEGSRSRLYTAKSIEELLVSAGYRIERMERTYAPVEREGYPEDILAEIESDPESETAGFVIAAVPLSNEAKHRAITKRFLTANSELAAARQMLLRREREIERLQGELAAARAVPQPAPAASEEAGRRQLVAGLRIALDQAIAQHDLVAEKGGQLKRELEATIANRDEIAARGGELARKLEETTIALQHAVATRDAAIADRADAIAARDAAALARDAVAAARDEAVAARDAAIADRTREDELQSRLERQMRRIGELQDEALALREDLTRREADIAAATDAVERARADLDEALLRAERELGAAVAAAVATAESAADARVAEVESARRSLEDEVFEAWGEIEAVAGERDHALDALAEAARRVEDERDARRTAEEAIAAAEAEAAATRAAAEAEMTAAHAARRSIEDDLLEAWLALERLETDRDALLDVLAESHRIAEEQAQRGDALDGELRELREAAERDAAAYAQANVELQAKADRLVEELSKKALEYATAVERVQRTEQVLADQADALTEATQAECRRLAMLIDTVQDGPYWKAKRFLDRFALHGR